MPIDDHNAWQYDRLKPEDRRRLFLFHVQRYCKWLQIACHVAVKSKRPTLPDNLRGAYNKFISAAGSWISYDLSGPHGSAEHRLKTPHSYLAGYSELAYLREM